MEEKLKIGTVERKYNPVEIESEFKILHLTCYYGRMYDMF